MLPEIKDSIAETPLMVTYIEEPEDEEGKDKRDMTSSQCDLFAL